MPNDGADTVAAKKHEQELSLEKRVNEALAWLERKGTKKTRDGMARYGIHADKAFGVMMRDMKALGKQLGRDHELAQALWESGWYEARMVVSFVAEPERLTRSQMDRWCREFDNWAVCDTLCFNLFDRTEFALGKAAQWARRKPEFVRRAGFALIACVASHDKTRKDKEFRDGLGLIEAYATDGRNFVKKAVSWALRAIGGRNPQLYEAALTLAERLAESDDPAERWIGKDAARGLKSPPSKRRLAKQKAKRGKR